MILYVSKRFETNIASQVHFKILEEKFGRDNIFVVDMRQFEAKREERYVSYGKYKNKIDRIGRWLCGYTMYYSPAIVKDICGIIEKYSVQLVFIEDSVFGSLVKRIKENYPDVKVISFYHDLGADLFVQWAKRGNILGKIECKLSIYQEKLNQRYCDINIVFNKRDAMLYKKHYNKQPDAIIPISTPVPTFDDLPSYYEKSDKKHFLFVGSKYYPNILGIKWFYENVLPELNDNIVIDIVGRGTEVLKNELTDSRIIIHGGVDSLSKYYMHADLVIVPLFDGGGMKTKTVEALSYGKVIVSTDEGMQGFWEELDSNIQGNIVFNTNDPTEWIGILNNLSKVEINRFNESVFNVYKKRFSLEATKKSMWNLLG